MVGDLRTQPNTPAVGGGNLTSNCCVQAPAPAVIRITRPRITAHGHPAVVFPRFQPEKLPRRPSSQPFSALIHNSCQSSLNDDFPVTPSLE